MLLPEVEPRGWSQQSVVLRQAYWRGVRLPCAGVCSVVVVVVVESLVASVQVRVVVFETAVFEVNELVGKDTLGGLGCCVHLSPARLHDRFQKLALGPWSVPLPLLVHGLRSLRSNDENPGTASWQESPKALVSTFQKWIPLLCHRPRPLNLADGVWRHVALTSTVRVLCCICIGCSEVYISIDRRCWLRGDG